MPRCDNNSFRLPTAQWLEEANEKLSRKGMPPASRPMEAYQRWCLDSKQHIGFGGEATKVIGEWFAKNTQYGKLVRQPIRGSAYFFDVSFWEVSLPLVYGTVEIEPLKQIRGIPPALLERLSKDVAATEEYSEHFASAYNFFVDIENLSMMKRSMEQQLFGDFLFAADRHLQSASSLLLAGNMKAIEVCRHVVELSLKAVLNIALGLGESQLKRPPYSHGLPSLYSAVADCLSLVELPILKSDLNLYPSIGVRYQETNFTPSELWQAFKLSQRLATFCLEHVLKRMIQKPTVTRSRQQDF